MTKREKQIIDIYEKKLLQFARAITKTDRDDELIKELSYSINALTPHIKIITALLKIDGIESQDKDDESELLKFMKTMLNPQEIDVR